MAHSNLMMVPSNTRMHPWEHGQVSWELGVSDSDLEGFVCQLWLSRYTFKWFLKLLLTRVLSTSTHVSLALPRKSGSQAGLGPVTHLPESLKTLVTVTLSFRGQSGDSEQKWPVELPSQPKPLHWVPASPLHVFHTNNKLLSPLLAFGTSQLLT